MSKDSIDKDRRRFLATATTVVGSVGVVCAAMPFLASWQPSASNQAAEAIVEVDLSNLLPGQHLLVEWQGKPVWVLRRDAVMLAELARVNENLLDPDSQHNMQPHYAQNQLRSIRPEYFVVVAVCTHLGCIPKYKSSTASLAAGLFCPCHGSKFDLAGRVFKGVPAPLNLQVPPHRYLHDSLLLIGEEEPAGDATR